uniref:Putative secreted protein n=1 Tax=Amblyomma parvum TaxID=251391 RepID=A0A023FVS0_AMBPA
MKTLLLVFVAVIALDVALARIANSAAQLPRRCHPFGWGALDPKRTCRFNEQCRPGSKSCGELQCRHFNSPPRKRPICTTGFTTRCFCRYGYCRNSNGKCIPIRRW